PVHLADAVAGEAHGRVAAFVDGSPVWCDSPDSSTSGRERPSTRMRCPACQHPCSPSTWSCEACAASLVGVCRACGAANAAEARFCNQCAHRLDRPRTERVFGTAAERRQLTVMFCDLVDSTPLSARLDPEDLRDVVQAYQEACGAVI